MPDWFYQPVYKPLVMGLLPAEAARRLTMTAMHLQSKIGIGRAFFDLLARTSPPLGLKVEKSVEVFGLRFPSPIGLAAGIDIEANALPLWPLLSLGFVQLGSVAAHARPENPETEPQLLRQITTVLSSKEAAAPSANELAAKLHASAPTKSPIGVALRKDALESLPILEPEADFFSIPHELALDTVSLNKIRSLSQKPLLLRFVLGGADEEIKQALENAVQAGFNGCIVFEGESTSLLPDGLLHGAHLREDALAWTRYIVDCYGDAFPVIGSAGIMSPADALAFFEAGAKLVQLYEGLIYAGPGLPRRIIRAIQTPSAQPIEAEQTTIKVNRMAALGRYLLIFGGLIVFLAGFFGIAVAFTVQLLPYELNYLGMTIPQLESYFAGRLAGFIFHDRIIYDGALIAFGSLYMWLAWYPLHPSRRETWAWWVLLISGSIGASSSFIGYLHSSYLDDFYGGASVILVGIFYIALLLVFPSLTGRFDLRNLLKEGSPMWFWSPAGLGRSYLLFWAATTALGGFLIFSTGMGAIYVHEDHEFMGSSAESIAQINERLTPFIAHDRLGFGVNLFAVGIAAFGIIWKSIRPNAKPALLALSLTYIVGHLTAVWVHPLVGYNSFSHLLPFIAKDIAFFLAILYLYRPLAHSKKKHVFPDL
jgi:dihydroorotate dehydrogenase